MVGSLLCFWQGICILKIFLNSLVFMGQLVFAPLPLRRGILMKLCRKVKALWLWSFRSWNMNVTPILDIQWGLPWGRQWGVPDSEGVKVGWKRGRCFWAVLHQSQLQRSFGAQADTCSWNPSWSPWGYRSWNSCSQEGQVASLAYGITSAWDWTEGKQLSQGFGTILKYLPCLPSQ